MAKQIPLNGKSGQGKFAVVDDEDYERLSQYRWRLNGQGYAIRHKPLGGHKYKTVAMQRDVIDCSLKNAIDHKDHNPLNNQKSNLRVATRSQNSANMKKTAKTKSGYKGVTFHKGTWDARIGVNYKRIHIGCFHSPEEAAIAYNEASLKYYGEFAFLNEIPKKNTE